MPFAYERTIRFPDTDAAGVVFFANTLRICHEAYEASLGAAGINLAEFFSAAQVIVPIAKTEAEYLRPLRCGDVVQVSVKAEKITDDSFAVSYEVVRRGRPDKVAARARTEHVCVEATKKQRRPFPPALAAWLSANAVGTDVRHSR